MSNSKFWGFVDSTAQGRVVKMAYPGYTLIFKNWDFKQNYKKTYTYYGIEIIKLLKFSRNNRFVFKF